MVTVTMGLTTTSILVSTIVSVLGILIYLPLAGNLKIVDRPNARSSHSEPTVRGGGIIFLLTGLYAFLFVNYSLFLLIGFLLIGLISIVDDLISLPAIIRVTVHFIGFACMLVDLSDLIGVWWIFPVLFIVCVGAMNAYNFMDGINGITGLYSLSVLIPSYVFFDDVSTQKAALSLVMIPSVVVFLFYNFRKKARCFAGDVGALTLGFIALYLVLSLMLSTGYWIFIFFLGIYGIDSVLTIIQRLYLKENIFVAHRKHLYQLLANEYSMSHRAVSLIYFILQFLWSFSIIWAYENGVNPYLYAASTAIPIAATYALVKWRLTLKLTSFK